MLSSSLASVQIGSQVNNSAWLVSFGDLLTLLLCFFVAVIASAPLDHDPNPQALEALRVNAAEAPVENRTTSQANHSGTLIANQDIGGLYLGRSSAVVRLTFRESDYLGGTDLLTEEARERMLGAAAGSPGIEAIVIKACVQAQSASLAVQRAKGLLNDLRLIGITQGNIRVESLSGICQVLGEPQDLGSVTILELRVKNG